MVEKLDSGVNLLIKATSIRWFGWGLGEAFLPILLLMLSDSFFGTGLLTSVYYVVFFLFIPLAGFLADRIKVKYMLVTSLFIYFFIGVGYFLAGFTGMIIFIILARVLNGVSYSLYKIGRESYFIRNIPKKKESEIFGKFDKIANFWWLVSILIGIFLINYTEIHWLLLAIAPTSIIAILFVLKLKEKPIKKIKKIKNPYKKLFSEIKSFNKNLKTLAVVVFFFSMISSIIYYFAPVVSYARGESLVNSALLILVYSIPYLFGEKLGKMADKIKFKTYFLSLFTLTGVLIILAFSPNYYLLLISMFFAGLTFEITSLANFGVIARNSEMKNIGKVDSALSGIGSIGSLIGPVLFGGLLEVINPMNSYFIILFLVGGMFIFIYKRTEI